MDISQDKKITRYWVDRNEHWGVETTVEKTSAKRSNYERNEIHEERTEQPDRNTGKANYECNEGHE
jgi:hypothetical protein